MVHYLIRTDELSGGPHEILCMTFQDGWLCPLGFVGTDLFAMILTWKAESCPWSGRLETVFWNPVTARI